MHAPTGSVDKAKDASAPTLPPDDAVVFVVMVGETPTGDVSIPTGGVGAGDTWEPSPSVTHPPTDAVDGDVGTCATHIPTDGVDMGTSGMAASFTTRSIVNVLAGADGVSDTTAQADGVDG